MDEATRPSAWDSLPRPLRPLFSRDVSPVISESADIHRAFRICKIRFASASFGLGTCPSVLEELNDENNA
ncbi:hypothetical protein RISK_000280 [Rhodopirellula islandica]|uniref:Uncharacterized protein n=1 Tax=Rhodopirellula islandica TaxID=595434 RepID=A0A0J1BMU4_RHOIS|nr:hypothetical protein RISK_000280 [Rhodopirellula islandica]